MNMEIMVCSFLFFLSCFLFITIAGCAYRGNLNMTRREIYPHEGVFLLKKDNFFAVAVRADILAVILAVVSACRAVAVHVVFPSLFLSFLLTLITIAGAFSVCKCGGKTGAEKTTPAGVCANGGGWYRWWE